MTTSKTKTCERLSVWNECLPASFLATLKLLRRRMRLSREIADVVVRARCLVTKKYHNNSLIREFSYVDNRKHGLERWWHNERKHAEFIYKDGKRQGYERWWHSNGVLRAVIPNVDDVFHGRARWWRSDRSLEAEITYCKGKVKRAILR